MSHIRAPAADAWIGVRRVWREHIDETDGGGSFESTCEYMTAMRDDDPDSGAALTITMLFLLHPVP